MILYGLSGTNGSGKDSLGQFLASEYNFLFISVTDFLRDEARARGLQINRENLRTISAEWRREHGHGVLVDKCIEQYKQEGGEVAYSGLVMASLRNPGEADRIHELGGTMVWLDADPQLRYKRIQKNARGRATEDMRTYQEFLHDEDAEQEYSGDSATLSLHGVKDRCDLVIFNDTEKIEDFNKVVKKALKL